MKKLGTVIARIISVFFGIMFLLASFGGIINCFLVQSNLLRDLVLTVVYFIIGIFLLRKDTKKQTETHLNAIKTSNKEYKNSFTRYAEKGNIILRTDGSEITDNEIPCLVQSEYERVIQFEKESSNPKFHRTNHEKDLAFNFATKYKNELSPLIEQFEYLYHTAYKTDNLSHQIEYLNCALAAFEKAKRFAYSKGKGGTIYFQDMYEYMHNSRNACFSYADLIQNSLDALVRERDVIIPCILNAISNNDGILQKNIYAELPFVSKSDIQRVIRKLETENTITRTKKSNSYELYLTKISPVHTIP